MLFHALTDSVKLGISNMMHVPLFCRLLKVGCQKTRRKEFTQLLLTRCKRCVSSKSAETTVVRHLRRRIETMGPLTVADYMREVLTNPVTGYYMSKDVFGTEGDFITSPEISQMFGELIALWVIHEWMQSGQSGPLQVVELGPGRGTLAEDMLRVFKQFEHIVGNSLSLSLVEVSPKMSQLQEQRLTSQQPQATDDPQASEPEALDPTGTSTDNRDQGGSIQSAYKIRISKTGVPVAWYRSLRDVPKGTACYIAHEFFDALPIHKFQKTDNGWREVLIDVDSSPDGPHHLRFVLAPAPTLASTVYPQFNDSRNHVEICPEGGVIVQEIANRIAEHGGLGLIIDYGHDGTKMDTLRGFKKHQLHDVFCEPGTADLTADVNFSYFRHVVHGKVSTYGPVNQEMFLRAMGIDTRLKMLLKNSTPEQSSTLISGYRMLTDPNQMGERFKFFAMLPLVELKEKSQPHTPAGFT